MWNKGEWISYQDLRSQGIKAFDEASRKKIPLDLIQEIDQFTYFPTDSQLTKDLQEMQTDPDFNENRYLNYLDSFIQEMKTDPRSARHHFSNLSARRQYLIYDQAIENVSIDHDGPDSEARQQSFEFAKLVRPRGVTEVGMTLDLIARKAVREFREDQMTAAELKRHLTEAAIALEGPESVSKLLSFAKAYNNKFNQLAGWNRRMRI